MTLLKLTKARAPAKSPQIGECRDARGMVWLFRGRLWKAGIVMAGAGAMSGCINVAAPDEPIVIELNINIRQEVIYRLAEDAANTVDANEDIF